MATSSGDVAFPQPAFGETGWHSTMNTATALADTYISQLRRGITKAEVTFTSTDTTPSVSGAMNFLTANASGTTITTFDDGTAGQHIQVRIGDANTIMGSGLTRSGNAVTCASGDVFHFYYNGSSWVQVGGTVGMGTRLVVLGTADGLSTWPAITITAPQDLDVSEAVRKGAVAALIQYYANNVNTATNLLFRPNGSSDTSNNTIVARIASATQVAGHVWVPLDSNAVCEVDLNASGVSATNWTGSVWAYII